MTRSPEQPDRPESPMPEPIAIDPPRAAPVAPLPVALSDVTFLHWAYEPEAVRPLLPPDTEPDRFDGAAYVGLVAFRMRSFGEFVQFNVRTYSVDQRKRRGVVFLAMEANRLPWVLAARVARLPYRWSRVSLIRDVDQLDYRLARRWPGPVGIGTRIRVRVGQPIEGNPLDHFLTARWRLHYRIPASPSRPRSSTTVGRCTPLTCWDCTTSCSPPRGCRHPRPHRSTCCTRPGSEVDSVCRHQPDAV